MRALSQKVMEQIEEDILATTYRYPHIHVCDHKYTIYTHKVEANVLESLTFLVLKNQEKQQQNHIYVLPCSQGFSM